MLALLAMLTLAPILYIPGLLISYALLGTAQPLDALERQYQRVVAGALLNGWLALTLAELGVFSIGLHLLLILAVCAGCAVIAWRRGALSLGRRTKDSFVLRPSSFVLRPSSLVAHWETLSFAAVGVVFVLLVARPFEVVLGARDAGVYTNTGFAIAATGGIVQHDPLVQQIGQDEQSADADLRAAAAQAKTNFLGSQNPERFIATRLRLSGFQIWAGDLDQGRVVPQFLHLYPAWVALLTSLLGLHGGLLATGLLGFLGVWSVGMLGRRLAGPWVGLLGALFLALNGVQVWFSRYSTSEACAQFLCFAALYGFAVMQDDRRPTTDDRLHAQPPTPISHLPSPIPQLVFGGLIAGLAAGQLALARIDFFVLVLPLLLYLVYMALTKRWSAPLWALTGGLAAMLLHALLHILFISRAYFFDTLYARLQDQSAILFYLTVPFLPPVLQNIFLTNARSAPLRRPLRLPIELGLLAVLVIVFVLLRRDGRPQRWFEQLIIRYQRGLLRAGAALIVLLGIYGYFIRPQILTASMLAGAPSCLSLTQLRAPSGDCLALQGYIGAPVTPPEHPNEVAYLLDNLPKFLRSPRLTVGGSPITIADTTMLFELPDNGAALGQLKANERLQLFGKTEDGKWYLVSTVAGTTGWIPAASISVDANIKAAPVQPADIVTRIVNPRDTTSFSVGNPGDSEKIGIAQANMVRLGWYLSPLGVVLGVLGFALWWRRGLTRSAWLFLVVSLISAFFFLRLAYGTTDLTYIYILRRYMPVVYPAFSLGMAYALVALAGRTKDDGRRTEDKGRRPRAGAHLSSIVYRLSSIVLVLVLIGFFVATNRPLYAHVEYQGALAQLAAVVGRYGFGANDVLLFRGEGRDTPDLVVTPLKYIYGLNAFAIRSDNPGKYAQELARYVQRWQAQGRQVYLVLGPNGAVELPGLRPERLGPFALHLPEFQQLRDQKPRGLQNFVLDFVVYRLAASSAAPAPAAIAVDDFAAQVRGFYHPEQIGGQALAWTDGAALLRLPWPRDGKSNQLVINLSPGATRPASLGPAQVCIAYRPESSFDLVDLPFSGTQCVTLNGASMAGYRFTIDTRGQPNPPTGTYLLRIASTAWVPAQADSAQIDQRSLGVQFGGIEIGN